MTLPHFASRSLAAPILKRPRSPRRNGLRFDSGYSVRIDCKFGPSDAHLPKRKFTFGSARI
jgi:hypothetical protein